MKLLFYFTLILSSLANASKIDQTSRIIRGIITQKSSKTINVKNCTYNKEKWAMLLITKQSFKETLKFNKGCDIEGQYVTKMEHFFNVPLKIRNKEFQKIKFDLKIEIEFKNDMILKLSFKNGQLHRHKDIFQFKGSQSFIIDPLNPDKIIKRNLGGSIHITHNKEKKTFKI
ncbi:MAG: hypothetical protein N4A33_05735 [Bacteriovoracaceae bacterium]|jgi:hypothetical protein|nr:hypothetical protein [Bacteriovoracaceae bacterium]